MKYIRLTKEQLEELHLAAAFGVRREVDGGLNQLLPIAGDQHEHSPWWCHERGMGAR